MTTLASYKIKSILGKGDNAVVFLVERDKQQFALKVIEKNTPKIDREIAVQKRAADLGCAPKILDDVINIDIEQGKFKARGERAIVMEIIKTFDGAKTILDRYQVDIMRRTWILLKNGIIHNDLHQGNVGIRKEGRKWRGVIFDFGEAEVIPPPKNNTVIRQLMVAQLFSMLTSGGTNGCNRNNTIDLCGDQPIHNAIYDIKAHTEASLDSLDELLGPDIDPRNNVVESIARLSISKLKY